MYCMVGLGITTIVTLCNFHSDTEIKQTMLWYQETFIVGFHKYSFISCRNKTFPEYERCESILKHDS